VRAAMSTPRREDTAVTGRRGFTSGAGGCGMKPPTANRVAETWI